jgi:hypothetical protein
MHQAISLLVGEGEVLGPRQDMDVLASKHATEPAQVVALSEQLPSLLAKVAPTGGVRSQMTSPGTDGSAAPYEATFQLFGHRLLIDSLVLSKVVYDSVSKKRMMPSGLDVMAAA